MALDFLDWLANEMLHWHKPTWLYEPLPYLYAVVGIGSAMITRNTVGVVSGIALCSAGVAIWKMRKSYRAGPTAKPAASAVVDDLPTTEDISLSNIVWNPSFELANPSIDRQHRRLFSLGNELVNAVTSKKSKADVELMVDDFVMDLEDHFRFEEDLLGRRNVPLWRAHKETHDDLLRRVREMRNQFHNGRLSAVELVDFLAHELVVQHVGKSDMKFRDFLSSET